MLYSAVVMNTKRSIIQVCRGTWPSEDWHNIQRPPGLWGGVLILIFIKGLQDSEEERGEPQRFKFLCQGIGDTATQTNY